MRASGIRYSLVGHFEANKIDLAKTPLKLGASLTMYPKTELFTGASADKTNGLLKGSYRKGFELPA